MAMEADTIEALAAEILRALDRGELKRAYALAGEIKGQCGALVAIESNWEFIKEEYEAGEKPRVLSRRHNVTVKEIYNRAYAESWVSPQKLKRAMKPLKKQTFYPNCRVCEQPFEAYSGHAIVCPTCKAFEKQKKVSGQLL